MKKKVIVASHNSGKVREIKNLLKPYNFDVQSASDLKIKEPKNIKDMTTVLNKIKHKKMYWALQRCLEAVPERRYLIYI